MERLRRLLVLAACLVLLVGCGIPQDPDRTLESARARGELVVGVSPSPPHVQLGADGEPSGPGPDVVRGFAESQGLAVRWVLGGEEQLVTKLEHNDVDLLLGGLTKQTPWSDKVGLTRAYATEQDEYGRDVERVLAVPIGENALVSAIERYLDGVAT